MDCELDSSSHNQADNRLENVTLHEGGPICQNVNFEKEDHTRLMFLTRNQRVVSFPKTSNNALVSWIELSNDSIQPCVTITQKKEVKDHHSSTYLLMRLENI